MIDPFDGFFRNKRVLITGHTGFKGSWLSLWLQELGANVIGYSLEPPSHPNLFDTAGVAKGMKSNIADLCDYENLFSIMQENEPEIVIHMAAQALVLKGYKEPLETFNTNIIGTVNVLETIRHVESVRSCVVVTTDKCYLNREWLWPYRENERLGGVDPYSSSKACAEIVTSAYRASFFNKDGGQIKLATARAGNVIGGGDWAANRLVPDCIRAFYGNQFIEIRSPQAIRPWQHVMEPLTGYLKLAKGLFELGDRFAEAWNFGPSIEDSKSVEWVVSYLCNAWKGSKGWKITRSANMEKEAILLCLDITKARYWLDWRPVWDIEEALKQTIDWYLAYRDNPNEIHDHTIRQIIEYSKQI